MITSIFRIFNLTLTQNVTKALNGFFSLNFGHTTGLCILNLHHFLLQLVPCIVVLQNKTRIFVLTGVQGWWRFCCLTCGWFYLRPSYTCCCWSSTFLGDLHLLGPVGENLRAFFPPTWSKVQIEIHRKYTPS